MDKLDLILQELTVIKSEVASVKSEVASVKSEVASVKSEVASVKSEVASLNGEVSTLKSEVTKLNVTIENEIKPQIKLLAEGQEALLVKLAPKTEVEKLREELDALRDIVKFHSREINELKKAQ